MMAPDFEIQEWGLVEYEDALKRQLARVEDRFAKKCSDALIICSHPAVVTLGRAATTSDVFGWTGPVIEISRGGRATYHGPNQEVIYPILDLSMTRKNLPARDLHAYMKCLEKIVIDVLARYGIKAYDSTTQAQMVATKDQTSQSKPSYTGVWVDHHKVASIGIAVTRWVSYHGVAINVENDP